MTIEIAAFVTALGHATNILKTAIQARDESKRREALTELMGALADLQAKHLAVIQNQQLLLEQNQSLQKKLAAYDKWEQEKVSYVLRQLPSGGLVYAFNPTQEATEPPHWICTNCYEDHHKCILQLAGAETGEAAYLWTCPRCKSKIIARGEWPQTLKPPAQPGGAANERRGLR